MISSEYTEEYLEPCQISIIKSFVKVVKEFQPLNIFAKKLHYRCLTGFEI